MQDGLLLAQCCRSRSLGWQPWIWQAAVHAVLQEPPRL